MSGRAPIRVLVAEDDPVVREALKALFLSEPSLEPPTPSSRNSLGGAA